MPRKTSGKKRGRPFTKIDWKKVDSDLMAGCPSERIASDLGISLDTLYYRCRIDNGIDYTVYRQSKKNKGLNLLQRVQYQKAIQGNSTMLTLLGVEMLGQGQKKTDGDLQNLSDYQSAQKDGKLDELIRQPDGV